VGTLEGQIWKEVSDNFRMPEKLEAGLEKMIRQKEEDFSAGGPQSDYQGRRRGRGGLQASFPGGWDGGNGGYYTGKGSCRVCSVCERAKNQANVLKGGTV
jgi:hypothetical protein